MGADGESGEEGECWTTRPRARWRGGVTHGNGRERRGRGDDDDGICYSLQVAHARTRSAAVRNEDGPQEEDEDLRGRRSDGAGVGVSRQLWYSTIKMAILFSVLTTAQNPASAVTLVFLHHIVLLNPFALLLKAVLCCAASPVRSTSRLMRSPRERTCSIFCVIMSRTAPSSACAAFTGSD